MKFTPGFYLSGFLLISMWLAFGVFVNCYMDHENNGLGKFFVFMKSLLRLRVRKRTHKLCPHHGLEFRKIHRPKLFFVVDSKLCDKCRRK